MARKEIEDEAFFWEVQVRSVHRNGRFSSWEPAYSYDAPDPNVPAERSTHVRRMINGLKEDLDLYYPSGKYEYRVVLVRKAEELYQKGRRRQYTVKREEW